MQTDISVAYGKRKIIIETKFYKETLGKFYDARTLHSANLYQLFSYLVNAKKEGQQV